MTTRMKRAAVAVLLVVGCGTASSGASYTASDKNVQNFGAAADFGVHVTMNHPGSPKGGSVPLSATVSQTSGGTITQVVYERSVAGANTWSTACTANAAAWGCSWATSGNGTYDLRARATDNSGYTRVSATVANVVIDNDAPNVTMDDPGTWFRGSAKTLSASTSDTGGAGMKNVRYEYKTTAGSTWTTACTGSTAPYSCTFNSTTLTNGTYYDFRAVATDNADNTTTSAAWTSRRPDNAAPAVPTFSAAPATNLRGTVTFGGNATDSPSGIATLSLQYSAPGANTWTEGCSDNLAPFSCTWDTTTVPSGMYDLRLLATDLAGNTTGSALAAGRRVDNVAPTTVLDPLNPTLTGTVAFTWSSVENTNGSGSNSGKLQFSAAGAGTWADGCVDTTTPFTTCSANSAGVADGLYDFRSVVTDVAGNTGYSDPVTNRRIENTVPSASDVQGANGGTAGFLDAGDTVTLTYSETMNPSSIIAGWNGSGEQDVNVRLTQAGPGDTMLFYNAANTATIPLAGGAGVDTKTDYVPGAARFSAKLTMNAAGTAFTVRLTALVTGSINATSTGAAAVNMVWVPAAGATDLAAKACSTTARTEIFTTADRDF